jgi:hypothetical protein
MQPCDAPGRDLILPPMSTRSTYLARTLVARLRTVAGSLAEDGATPGRIRERMRDLVAKVLVVEEGITEESKVRLVLDAMPALDAKRDSSDRELKELAATLEAQLWR